MPVSVSRSIAWVIWFIASLFYAYQYILRVMPNIMMSDIIQHFHIDSTIFGQFSGVYYIGYSLVHLPIGIMLDKFGPRRVMSACILLTVIGLLPLLIADNWIYPVLGRALIGIGSSAAILGAFKIIRMSFRENLFTRLLSLTVTIGLIGAIYGGGPLALMRESLGYTNVIKIMAGFGLLLALLTYIIVPDIENTYHGSITTRIKEVLSNKKVIILCFLAGLMVGPLEGFADVWASSFLREVYGFNMTLASYIPSMIFIGMCFGAPVLSYVAEKSGNHLLVIMTAGFIMTTIFVLLLIKMMNADSMMFGFIIIGVCCAYQILAIYKASTYVSEHAAGLTTAVANMIIMSFGYAFHSIIGFSVDYFGGVNNPNALLYGVSVIPIFLALGSIGFFCLFYQEHYKSITPSKHSLTR